jgi:mannose-6-phosphate isomerase-like protein (cupin superfamily)
VLVRRFSDAAAIEVHRLSARILMDAGELGSRHLSVNWVELPAGASEELRSHEDAEQVYVVVRGTGTIAATGDHQRVTEGDLAMIAPATDHALANDGPETLALVSIQAPGVSADELFSRRLAVQAAGYDGEYDDE